MYLFVYIILKRMVLSVGLAWIYTGCVCGGPDGDRPGFVTPNSKLEPGGVFFNLYCQVNFFNMEFYLEK